MAVDSIEGQTLAKLGGKLYLANFGIIKSGRITYPKHILNPLAKCRF
jgi:hypothetical protein